jgi:hypothetical protein
VRACDLDLAVVLSWRLSADDNFVEQGPVEQLRLGFTACSKQGAVEEVVQGAGEVHASRGTNPEPGRVQSTGKICFRRDHTKFMTTRTAVAVRNGNSCLDCGTVELVREVEKARSLVERTGAH